MKKVFILTTSFFTVLASSVLAQSSGITPHSGATHSYWVNSSDDGASQDAGVGNLYTWHVADDSDLSVALAETDFSFASGYNAQQTDLFSVDITWKATSLGKTYYLVVKEEGASGCENIKAMAIAPLNAFVLVYVAMDESDIESDDPLRCAPSVTLTASGTTITYDYGSGDYIFKLTPAGISSAWSFDYDIATGTAIGNAVGTYEYSLDDGSTYATLTGGTVSVPAGTANVYVKASLDNGDTGGVFEEGLSDQTVQLTLSNVADDGANIVTEITNSVGADISSLPVQVQTINSRPATTGIGTN